MPVDSEGSCLLHKVPVVSAELTVGSTEVAGLLTKWLKEHRKGSKRYESW